jgi:hypothetical protein
MRSPRPRAASPTSSFPRSAEFPSSASVARDTTSSTAEDISKAVDDLLDFGTLTISGGTLLHLARDSDVDYVEVVGDQQYRHHGANYRLVVAT